MVTLNRDGILASVTFAEQIPHRTIKKGWIVDVRYAGLNVVGIASDEQTAKDLIETLIRSLCAKHGLQEPACLADQGWRDSLTTTPG